MTSQMRVAVVCPYDLRARGGVQVQCEEMVVRQRERGIDAYLVGPGVSSVDSFVSLGKATVAVPTNGSVAPISVNPAALRTMLRVFESFDVLHVHEPCVPLVGWAAMLARVPKVTTFHAAVSSPILRTVAGLCAWIALRRSSRATAVSESAKSTQSRTSIETIPNGVDTSSFRPTPKQHGSVVFIGRDEPRKGLDVLLEAWTYVQAHVADARLDVIGTARDESSSGVIFHGRVTEQAKQQLLGQAWVMCAPNLGAESFGTILLEGLASGCTVVASDLPAFQEVGGDAIRYVKRDRPDHLGPAIVAALSEPPSVNVSIARASRFGWESILSRYERIYSEVTGVSP